MLWAGFVLLLTGSIYTYEVALAASVAFGILIVYLILFHRQVFRSRGVWLVGALVAVVLLIAPHVLDPAAWGRTSTQTGALAAIGQGDWQPLADNVVSALRTFSFSGDSFITYNLPGRPIFGPVTSLLFYGGIVLCLRRWRQPRYAFVLMWLAAGMLPTLIVGEWLSTLHSMGAQAPIMALPVLAAVELGRTVSGRLGRRWQRSPRSGRRPGSGG